MVWTRCHALFAGLLALLAGCAVPVRPATGLELIVLGTAQDGGLPHLGCSRPCCEQARANGRRIEPTSLAVWNRASGELLLLEATPSIERQVALLHAVTDQRERGRRPVDGVLLTHAHIGHYAGLVQFGREVASTDATPVWVTPRFASYLRDSGPWRQLVELEQIALREIEIGVPFAPLPGLEVTAIAVPHRDEFSDTVAFELRGPHRTVLFVPDVDRWDRTGDLLDRLLEDVDVAFVDGTFYDGRELPDRNLGEIAHPLVVDTMARLAKVGEERPGTVRFIHLNHTNPLLHDPALVRELEARGFALARTGDRVEL